MDRVFLDANILFSAGYDPRCRIMRLWRINSIRLLASPFVAGEAISNLQIKRPEKLKTLVRLLKRCELINEATTSMIPAAIELPAKDRPVLAAAIAGNADFLLTGDTHFRPYFGRVIERVTIMRPGDYLNLRGH